MNLQADQASHQVSSPPLFQAIGSLTGQLAVDQKGRYRLRTPDEKSFPVRLLGRMNKLIRGQSEFLGLLRSWTVYPRTNPLGKLTSVQLIRMGSQANLRADAFYISGCVVPPKAEGLISVKIKSNQPGKPPPKPPKLALPGQSFPPFYLNLQGYLPGDPVGEVWRFDCQRQGLHLEMLDAVKVKGRPAHAKQR